jgi:hypothetical protein
MLNRWPQAKIPFTATRWKAPIRRGNVDFYLFSPRGVPYTETSLRGRVVTAWHHVRFNVISTGGPLRMV